MNWLKRILDLFIKPWPIPEPPPTLSEPVPRSALAELKALMNRERTNRGLEALADNDALTYAAQTHAYDMATTGRLDHIGADGSTFGDRCRRVGYPMAAGGEIIAGGPGQILTPSEVVAMWMASPGHRIHGLSAEYRDFGAGKAGDFWCVDFGRRT